MHGRIRISPDQVRQVSAQFRNASSQSHELVARLGGTVKALEPDWEGITKERFFSDFTQWETSMRQFVELLNGISAQLEQIAERFEAADQSA